MKNKTFHTAYIVLTEACNARCPYCFYKQGIFPRRPIRFSGLNINEAAARLAVLKPDEAVITGGEPLLEADLALTLSESLTGSGIRVGMNTNGLLLDRKMLSNLEKAGCRDIYLSSRYWHALDPGLVELMGKRFELSVIHVIAENEIPRSRQLLQEIANKGISLIVQPAFICEDGPHAKEAEGSKNRNSNEEEIMLLAKKYSSRWRNIYESAITSSFNHEVGAPSACHMGTDDFICYPDGELFPCFHRQDLRAGNLFEDDPEIISNRLENLARQTADAGCFGAHCVSLFY